MFQKYNRSIVVLRRVLLWIFGKCIVLFSFNNKLNSFRGFIRAFYWRVPILPTDLVITVQTLSGSTDNFLKILRIFLDPNNSWKLPRTVWDSENYLELRDLFPRTIWGLEDFLRLPRAVWHFRELFETSKNCLRLPRTVWDFRGLFKTFENCLTFPITIWDFL